MGGRRLLHLFDFHHGYMGRKHKKRGNDGVEAPCNSTEMAVEKWQGHYAAEDTEQDLSLSKRSSYSVDASMKKLINQEIMKRANNQQTSPSVVAKLMGMDMLPLDSKPETQLLEESNNNIKTNAQKTSQAEKVSAVVPLKSKASSKKEHRSYKDSYFRYWSRPSSGSVLGKPRPRVHPQEKELQKFKKDFEAWQATRFLECARVVELGNIPEQWLAQLDLTKEKMSLYETSRKATVDHSMELNSKLSKSRSFQGSEFQHVGHKKETSPSEHNESYSFSGRYSSRDFEQLSGRYSSRDFEQLSLQGSDMNFDKSSNSARIVILKPGPDSFTTNDESWVDSCSMGDRDCIEDLLEEVKQRLKFEMQGKTSNKGSMIRGGGIETPFKEKPAYTKQAYQPVAKQARENFSRHSGRKLVRSESARSYRSEIQENELIPSSPELRRRDTRKFLSERLRNVLTEEDQQDIPNIFDEFPRSPLFDEARERLEKARDILNAETGRNYWQYMNCEGNTQGRSFRHQQYDDTSSQEHLSPRNLVRSLSAPLSGASFGRLLLEDRYVSSGARIKRKHEALDNLSADDKHRNRERFNIREKVSNIKHSLSLRKKLFSKNLQSMDMSQSGQIDSPKDIRSGPTILRSFNERSENLTEVPPSPASICNSPREDLWKPMDNPSPLSASDVTSVGDHSVGNVFREISSNLTELRKQLNQLEYEGSEITTVTEDPSEEEVVEFEDETEAYIKDLLVTSGLYDGSWDKSFSRGDPYMKPVSNWVFEKVEECYQKPSNENEEDSKIYDDTKLEHKLVFDLLNEALTIVFGPPRTLSKFRRKITDATMLPRLQGRKLLEQVWEMIREYIYPSIATACNSLEDLIAHDLNIRPWYNLIDEEITAVGKELEHQMTDELVEELVVGLQV